VKLDEFHVFQCRTRSEGDGHSISGGNRGVGGSRKQLTGAPGGQDHGPGPDQRDDPSSWIQHNHPATDTLTDDKVQGECIGQRADPISGLHLLNKRLYDLFARSISVSA